MERHEDILELIQRYRLRQLSPEELARLLSYLRENGSREEVEAMITSGLLDESPETFRSSPYIREKLDKLLIGINQKRNALPEERRYKKLFYRLLVAAMLLAVFAAALYFYRRGGFIVNRESALARNTASGNHRAILTLANGQIVHLDSTQSGIIVHQEDIRYNDGNSVVLQQKGKRAKPLEPPSTDEITNNCLATPRGGQYQVILSDGTKVWLNAQTVLRYPSKFSGPNRQVFLTGEAYFEVASDKGSLWPKPFVVKTRDQEITVLGTEFNISAFEDDNKVKTTLVKGAVKVANKGSERHTIQYAILNPGEQSILTNSRTLSKVKVNLSDEIAWKDGLFKFRDASIADVMKQLARWYDLEVLYEGTIPEAKIEGEVYRNMSLQQVVEVLGGLEINIRLLGKKIIISSKP